MLHNLPVEIILLVSRLLNFRDKLSLTATCRKLNDLVSKANLYEEIDLTTRGNNIKSTIQAFVIRPSKGIQVKRLKLDRNALPDKMIPQLSTLFPNLAKAQMRSPRLLDTYKQSPVPEPLASWTHTLTEYETDSDWEPIWFALQHYTFPKLTALKIVEDIFMDIGPGSFDRLCFLKCIKNAPALKTLSIGNSGLTLDFLEQLHECSPCIQSLSLDSNLFKVETNILPECISPATSILSLQINNTVCFDANGLFLDYIVKKYPNMQRFCFTVVTDKCLVQVRLKDVLDRNSIYFSDYGNRYKIDNNHCTKITAKDYKTLIPAFESTIEMYRNSTETFFLKLPKTIERLHIDINIFNNTIEVLARSEIKLYELQIRGIFTPLKSGRGNANQLVFLNNITLLKTMKWMLKPLSLTRNNQEVFSGSLIKLTIDVKDGLLNIPWLLSVFPSLQELYVMGDVMERVYLEYRSKTDQQKSHLNLQKISIKNVGLRPSTMESIKAIAPYVKILDLNAVMKSTLKKRANEMDEVELDLTGWKLEKCWLNLYHEFDKAYHSYYKITIGSTTRAFGFTKYEDTIRFHSKAGQVILSNIDKRVHVKCDNFGYLEIRGFQMKESDGKIVIFA